MEFIATALRYSYSGLSILLVITLISQSVSSSQHTLLPGIGDVSEFCEGFPVTSLEHQLCKKYPELLFHLFTCTELSEEFKNHCQRQFKHEKWDCKNISMPLSEETSAFLSLETKEAAFVYALASGTIVHTVAQWCAKNDSKVDYCGCDQTLGTETLLHNEKWAGCSPDIHFGMNFTKQLVNARVNNATPRYKAFVVHNSEIGQLVVEENMKKSCKCTESNKYTCSRAEACQMILPKMENVVRKLKMKYQQSVHLTVPSVVDMQNQELIYFNNSIDYCVPNPDYNICGVEGRLCTINRNHTTSSHHCNNLCCGHGHEEFTVQVPQACNCKFVWCCHVECDTCHTTVTKHRCKSKN